jgi:1-acyl-sn-glycerol-3-phosphate acyltransferase
MKSILGYILSPFYYIAFGLLLLIFHPVQIVCLWIGGYQLRKKSVDVMNYLLLYSLKIIGTSFTFEGLDLLPESGPFIIVSNHQNFLDITPIVWVFRKHHPKFVSKMELGKNIPSVSYNLRHGGSALIDRNNARQSIAEILKLGKHIEKEKYCASIFPEGTRTKDGKVRQFQHAGINSLLHASPSSLIVPFVIDGNFQLKLKGDFPLMFGTKITYKVLAPINPKGRDIKELTAEIEQLIRTEIEN